MEKGFVPDLTYGAVKQTVWHKGDPKPATAFGFKMASIDVHGEKGWPITTYRCTDCGVLRSYAPFADKE